ncbi:Rhabdoid tumor deletion region protein 1 [Tupaia chinensis]|uniref:Rhabdoid tumor deletion region protein 1 n=1 Tax=Tupaia chinensis TaxID=246437 RepID=L9JGF5_TUPCH|nr:Rhabdoid tumor deletion region protein 1 [Tupaia chinensis]
MADARISMYLPPDVNPAQAAIAYGCRALPKLNEELQSEDLVTRQKALMALCDLMHDPEYVYEAINIGCLKSLKALLKDDDDMVRIKTTEVLYIMATHNVGRDGFLEHDIILALSTLLDDPNPICRENLHQAYKHLAQLPAEGICSEDSWSCLLQSPPGAPVGEGIGLQRKLLEIELILSIVAIAMASRSTLP